LITEDHELIREGLKALLSNEPGMEVVGAAPDAEQAIELTRQLQPDIVLMDISMPGRNGIEATRAIREAAPATRVLMLTVHEEKELVQEALRSGASGYVLKQALKSELINAIHAVLRGDIYVHSSLAQSLFNQAPAAPQAEEEIVLTSREIETLKLIAQGYTNSEIGRLLSISVRTVEFHRSNLMDKLGVDSRAELVRYAAEHGLI
jgi:two-component system response regulator NreC